MRILLLCLAFVGFGLIGCDTDSVQDYDLEVVEVTQLSVDVVTGVTYRLAQPKQCTVVYGEDGNTVFHGSSDPSGSCGMSRITNTKDCLCEGECECEEPDIDERLASYDGNCMLRGISPLTGEVYHPRNEHGCIDAN